MSGHVDTRTEEEKVAARKKVLADADRWQKEQAEKAKGESIAGGAFVSVVEDLKRSFANLPEHVEIPYERTPEGERLTRFKRGCDERFFVEVDFSLVRDLPIFNRVVKWDGAFPGPCITGPTGVGKTFAAWQALRELYVKQSKSFKRFTVRDLVAEMARYESNECIKDFYWSINFFVIIFVDDLDKINWDFESHAQMLFAFLDWIYRTKKPCIVTTNRDRVWWKAKCGEAFVRRLFDDGFFEVSLK